MKSAFLHPLPSGLAHFRGDIHTVFISALNFSNKMTIGSFRESTYNTHNIFLSQILNRVYICPIPDQIIIQSLFSNSEINEMITVLCPWDVE